MAAQAWQHTNVNFNDVNGAMATAAGSFSKAGSLAQGLVKSIDDQKRTELKRQQTNYLLDTENRNKRIEQDQFNLGIQRNQDKALMANQILQEQEQAAQEQQLALNKQEFAKRLDNQGVSLIDDQPHPMSPEIAALPTLLTTPSGGLSNEAIAQGAPTELPADFDRKQFTTQAYKKLLESGRFNPTEAMAIAQQEADSKLGPLATAEQIKAKQDFLKDTHDGKIKQFEAMMKTLKGAGGNTTNYIGTGVGGRGGNGYSTETSKLQAKEFEDWVNNKFDKDTSWFGKVFSTSLDSDNRQVNKESIAKNAAMFKSKYGIPEQQYMALVSKITGEGRWFGKYAPEALFSKDPKVQSALATEMAKYGPDSRTTRTKSGAAINAETQLKLNATKAKAIKSLYAKMQEADKAYEHDYNVAAQAGTPLTGKQRAFRKYESMRKASDVVLAPSKSDKSFKSAPGDKVRKLFTDNSNPVVKAWNHKDKEGVSSLAELVTKDPKAFAEGVAGLSKEEKAKVKKFTHTKAYLDILKAKSKVATKEEPKVSKAETSNNTTSLIGQHKADGVIPSRDLSSADTIKLRQAGYIPVYNSLKEVVGWENIVWGDSKTPTEIINSAQQNYLLHR